MAIIYKTLTDWLCIGWVVQGSVPKRTSEALWPCWRRRRRRIGAGQYFGIWLQSFEYKFRFNTELRTHQKKKATKNLNITWLHILNWKWLGMVRASDSKRVWEVYHKFCFKIEETDQKINEGQTRSDYQKGKKQYIMTKPSRKKY